MAGRVNETRVGGEGVIVKLAGKVARIYYMVNRGLCDMVAVPTGGGPSSCSQGVITPYLSH